MSNFRDDLSRIVREEILKRNTQTKLIEETGISHQTLNRMQYNEGGLQLGSVVKFLDFAGYEICIKKKGEKT